MPYKTSHIEDENIVCMKGYGRLTIEEYQKGSLELVDLLTKHSSTRLFVDNRFLDNAASVGELYDLPRYFRKIGLPESVRVALLVDPAGASFEDILFFENVCRNKGFNVNMFFSYKDAMEWLKK